MSVINPLTKLLTTLWQLWKSSREMCPAPMELAALWGAQALLC